MEILENTKSLENFGKQNFWAIFESKIFGKFWKKIFLGVIFESEIIENFGHNFENFFFLFENFMLFVSSPEPKAPGELIL